MNLQIVKIDKDNIELLSDFLKTISVSKKSFRYFENRGLECLENHLATLLLVLEDAPVAYGHLDADSGKVWLGICVSDDYKGIGIGKKMMKALFREADKLKLKKIHLSVDKTNKVAYNLYKKLGFVLESESREVFYMEKRFV